MSNSIAGAEPARDFVRALEQFGDRDALFADDGTRLSYASLAARADAFAERLGTERRLVAIEASNDIDTVVALIGALRGGHVVLPIAPDASARNRQMLETYRPDSLFAKSDGKTSLSLHPPAGHLHPDLALLLSTSGTTGAVKLVRLSRNAVNANAASIAEYLGLDENERAITSLPLHYSYGLSVLTSHLSSGASVLLTDASVVEPSFWDFFDAEGGTSFAGVPHSYDLIERTQVLDRALPTLRTLTQAGGRMPPATVSRIAASADARGRRLFVMYGQTEATARMSYLPPELAIQHPDCVGRAIPGGRFSLIDPDGNDVVGAGRSGELVYHGPNVMLGYAYCREDLATPREIESLHTGDLAEQTPEGLYRIVGRKSRFVKPFGLRVGLDEVEARLAASGVDAMVAGNDDVIAIVCRGAVPQDMVTDLAASLMLPAGIFHVHAVDECPLLASGKRDYRTALACAVADRSSVPDRTTQTIASVYADVFPGAAVAATDSFSSLGGDSLNYVVVALRLERLIGEVPDRWEEMSVGTLEALVGQEPPAPSAWWRWRTIESEIILRALAIIAVVVNHTTDFIVGGGASILLMLAGFSMARYQRDRWARGEGAQILQSFALRIILPYYILMIAALAFRHDFDVPSLLLVSNFTGRFGNILEPYWFLELLLQCMMIMVALFTVPAVRAFSARDPWRFGLVLLAASLAMDLTAPAIFPRGHLGDRTPGSLFYLLALGWCLNLARSSPRKVLISFVVLGIASAEAIEGWLLSYGRPFELLILAVHAGWLLGGGMLILWLPRVRVPGAIYATVTAIAATSFYIYLGHGIPAHFIAVVHHNHGLVLNIGAAILSGLLLMWLVQGVTASVNAFRTRYRRAPSLSRSRA